MQADISVVTYTYNDGRLVDDLLSCIATWSFLPLEIVILDDGSVEPYIPKQQKFPLRLIRNDANQGITKAKHKAISSCGSSYILAMDCDARIDSSWIEYCLPHAQRPAIGMVSGPSIYLSGDDSVSRYQRMFGDNHNLGKDGLVDFIPGNAFLLRRDVWKKCGGMADFGRDVCEDHYLCSKIKSLGLGLLVEPKARIKQVRRISRVAMFKRYWKWCHRTVKGEAQRASCIEDYIYAGLVIPHSRRLRHAIESDELLFMYYEMIYLIFTILDVLDYLSINNCEYKDKKANVWEQIGLIGSRYPILRAIMRADLAQLGQVPVARLNPCSDIRWESIFEPIQIIGKSGIFSWLDQIGISKMLEEEKSIDYDFSFYEFAKH